MAWPFHLFRQAAADRSGAWIVVLPRYGEFTHDTASGTGSRHRAYSSAPFRWAIASQRALGVLMGLDKKLASSRINRYENETSGIDLDGLGKLAEVLGVPMAYLVAEDEAIAEVILALSKMTPEERAAAVRSLRKI